MKRLALILATGVLLILTSIASADVSACSNLGYPTYNFSCSNFKGFYYDNDHGICTETLALRFSNITADKSSATLSGRPDQLGMCGVTYWTTAYPKNFAFKLWGQYETINFLGYPCLAAYDGVLTSAMIAAGEPVAFLANRSTNANLLASKNISRILMDTGNQTTITSASSLKLMEGYQLALKGVDSQGNKVYLELSKNGQVVESKVISPSMPNAKMAEKTYYYSGLPGLVTIAVHFKNAFSGTNGPAATVDGIYQISDTPIQIRIGTQYDKLSVKAVDSASKEIILNNRDNQITLTKGKSTGLFGKLYLQTAIQPIVNALHPLGYCLVKKA